MRKMSEMPYHTGMKIKLHLSDRQKHLVAVNDGARRAVYNHLVACGNERYRLKKTAALVPVEKDRLAYLDSVIGAVKNIKNAMPFLYGQEVDEQAIANAVKNYKGAWKNCRELHTGVPVFKKKSYERSYQTNAHYYLELPPFQTATCVLKTCTMSPCQSWGTCVLTVPRNWCGHFWNGQLKHGSVPSPSAGTRSGSTGLRLPSHRKSRSLARSRKQVPCTAST